MTPWTAAHQASLFITNSQSLLKLISIELVRPSNRIVPCHYLLSSLSDPITSWQIDGGTVETVTDFIFLGFQITVDGDCSHEIKRRLLLGRKAMTNLDSVIKSRDISLPTKVRLVKAMIFPVVMYGCESWTIKNAEPKELMLGVGRRLLRVPWTAGRSNQSIQRKPTVNIHWKD